ncbi:cyclomaltodextrinase N-terminal domain-containing protein, partial [Streptomyces sp. UMAF16]|nr:cyclomaltodextrinase N-terminal domain-containing protein [Streptomyces sp. UMAF16]
MLKNNLWYFVLFVLFVPSVVCAQDAAVYPSNWWVGMQQHQIQLLIKSATPDAIATGQIQINYP